MKLIRFILKIDKWLTVKSKEESWTGVLVSLGGAVIGYAGFYWLPEIALFFGGDPTPPLTYKWYMMLANFFFFGILLFTLLTVFNLLRKRK
jgi:hypothetical protein